MRTAARAIRGAWPAAVSVATFVTRRARLTDRARAVMCTLRLDPL